MSDITKKILVKAIVYYIDNVPEEWDADDINEFFVDIRPCYHDILSSINAYDQQIIDKPDQIRETCIGPSNFDTNKYISTREYVKDIKDDSSN